MLELFLESESRRSIASSHHTFRLILVSFLCHVGVGYFEWFLSAHVGVRCVGWSLSTHVTVYVICLSVGSIPHLFQFGVFSNTYPLGATRETD